MECILAHIYRKISIFLALFSVLYLPSFGANSLTGTDKEVSSIFFTGTIRLDSESGSIIDEEIFPDISSGSTLDQTIQEEKLKEEINASIVEFIVVPKARQIVKDLTIKLTKKFPNPEDRIKAYRSIQKTLELRKNRIDTMNLSKNGKKILKEFPSQIIDLLEKKIEELE